MRRRRTLGGMSCEDAHRAARRRGARLVLVTAAFGAMTAASALAFYEPFEKGGDLDGDPGVESARTAPVIVSGEQWTEVRVSDACPDGTTTDRRISGVEESLGHLRLVEADTVAGREVFVDLRSGASGRAGEFRLVAWRPAVPCPAPRTLFSYATERSSRPPRGALRGASNFRALVRNVERRFPGREVVLDEFFVGRGGAGCCPSFRKRRYFRFDRRSDRYKRYRTRVTRLRAH